MSHGQCYLAVCVITYECIFDEAIWLYVAHMTAHRFLTLFYLCAPGDSKVSLMMAL